MSMVRNSDGSVVITLSDEWYGSLLLALGIAAGFSSREGNTAGMYRAFQLANEVNEGNPQWTPYDIPEEFR